MCNKLETKAEREEENLVPKKLDLVVKTVRFKDEDSKNAGNILKSRKSIKLFHNNNNTITSIKNMTTTISPSKQNVLMATFGRKKEVKINKPNNNYTATFVKDFKSLRSNDICKPVEKKCNTMPANMKPMVSIPQIEVQRALKHSAIAINKLSIKEEKPNDIPKLKICVPKTLKEEPIDTKMFRKLSIDERPVNESVDLETYVKKIGLQPIDKKLKLSPNTSPSSSSSSSASSLTSSFPFNNNESEHHHRHSLSSSSSSSHKKRKKSKHSKEPRDKDSSSSKKRKIHAEISSSNENLKLKVKINHHNHKSSNDKVVKIVEAPILAPAQLSKTAIEKLRIELPPKPVSVPIPIQCPPIITSIKLKDTKLPISPPLPPSLFKTLPHTIQTVSATSTISPLPQAMTMTVNRSNVKQITTNTSNKEKFIMPSPPKTTSSSSAVPIKVNLITSIASEANRQASMKRSISVDDGLESKKKIAKANEEKARRISFGSLNNQQKSMTIQAKPINNKLCEDLKKSLILPNVKIPQPIIVSPTKATRPPPPTIPLLKIKRSLQLPTSPTNNNNEPPGL